MPRNQSNRGGSRRGNNNNPEGKNQYNNGLFGAARDRPATAAITAAGAVAAGIFLWSKRAQISDQISQLSDQIGEWTDQMSADRDSREFETVGSGSRMTGTTSSSTMNSGFNSGGNGSGFARSGDPLSSTDNENPVI